MCEFTENKPVVSEGGVFFRFREKRIYHVKLNIVDQEGFILDIYQIRVIANSPAAAEREAHIAAKMQRKKINHSFNTVTVHYEGIK